MQLCSGNFPCLVFSLLTHLKPGCFDHSSTWRIFGPAFKNVILKMLTLQFCNPTLVIACKSCTQINDLELFYMLPFTQVKIMVNHSHFFILSFFLVGWIEVNQLIWGPLCLKCDMWILYLKGWWIYIIVIGKRLWSCRNHFIERHSLFIHVFSKLVPFPLEQ